MRPQLFCLLQRQHLMPTIASVLLLTFTWLLIYPTALAAQTLSTTQHMPQPPAPTPGEEAEFPALLAQIETRLSRWQEQLERGEDTRLDPAALAHFRQRLTHLDTRARQQFAQMAQHLQAQNLPEVIHQRHRDAVATYEAAVATLRQQLDDLAAATTPQARHAGAAGAAGAAGV